MTLTMTDYQERASATAVYDQIGHPLVYPALGLAGETGELVDKVKKLIRNGTEIDIAVREELVKELGDILWYVAAFAKELGVDLEHVAWRNLAKLKSRQERGTLKSEGDNR